MPKRASDIWFHFNRKETNRSQCKHCKFVLSTAGGSFGNLKRHLKHRHPNVTLGRSENTSDSKKMTSTPKVLRKCHSRFPSLSADLTLSSVSQLVCKKSSHPIASCSISSVQFSSNKTGTLKSNRHHSSQSSLTEFLDIIEPLSHDKSKCIDLQLLKMICRGYHPFRMVEDAEFRKFVSMLCPNYHLPNRKTLVQSLLPQIYDNLVEKVLHQLKSTEAIAITTDRWTSINNQSFIAITAHYISENLTLCSNLLGCLELRERQSPANLAEALKKELKKWNIEEKVVAVVSDNAPNLVAAVELNNWKHIVCYAYSLNLIVKSSMLPIDSVLVKCKTVVEYFIRSGDALSKFHEIQRQLEMPELKLVQDIPTRWNTTLEMLKRVFKNKAVIIFTLTFLEFEDITFFTDDWIVIEHLINVLEVFDEVTKELSAEKTVNLPKVMILSRSLFDHISAYKQTPNLPKLMSEVCTNMLFKINDQLISKEHEIILESTFVDPRFKKLSFKNKSKFEATKNSLMHSIQIQISKEQTKPSDPIKSPDKLPADSPSSSKIWKMFDEYIATLTVQRNPKEQSVVEIDSYLSEIHLARLSDPLLWWCQKKVLYPHIYNIALKCLCIPASSVPYDQIFSKASQVMNEKRNHLGSKHLSKILFINCNS